MEDKYYAILYRVTNLGEEYRIYTPINVVVGTYIENQFLDEAGNTYLDVQMLDTPLENIDYRVGNETLEIDLKNEYPNDNDENLKMHIFDSFKNNILIGIEDYVEYTVQILEFSLEELFKGEIIEEQKKQEKKDFKVEVGSQSEYNDLPKIFIDINSINCILNTNSDKEIVEKLKYIRDKYISVFEKDERYSKLINKLKVKCREESLKQTFSKLPEVKDNCTIDTKKLYKQVTEKVRGQDNAVKEVISCIVMDQKAKTSSEKNRALLIGQSGTGKTLILDTISELLDIPMIKYDSTQLTMPGYVGQSLDDVLNKLLDKTKGDYNRAKNGIVVFDEIDKKGSLDNSDVSGKGVLNTLLPFIDGTTYTLKSQKVFDTSNLSILFSGAFSNVFEAIGTSNKKMGFGNDIEGINYKRELTDEDLVKYGQIPPELIGRIPNIIQLNPHTKETLYDILKNSTISPILSEKNKLNNLDVDLKYYDDYLFRVIDEALKLKTGARSLKKIIEKSIKDARWEILCNPNKYKSLTITSETVDNPKKYVLKYRIKSY